MQMVPHPGDERREEFYYLVNIQELLHLTWSGIPTNDFKKLVILIQLSHLH